MAAGEKESLFVGDVAFCGDVEEPIPIYTWSDLVELKDILIIIIIQKKNMKYEVGREMGCCVLE